MAKIAKGGENVSPVSPSIQKNFDDDEEGENDKSISSWR
jgi:hypothetical protein